MGFYMCNPFKLYIWTSILYYTKCFAVRPTAEIIIPETRLTVDEGSTATIRCEVTGTPQPTITWIKSRGELTSRHRVSGGTLRIVGAQVEDRGVYLCIAENTAGSDQDWVIVEVLPRSKPSIALYPGGTSTITVGGTAIFVCRASGEPPPTVTWTRAGGESFESGTELKQEGTLLMISRVTGKEQGSYICTATNSMGSVSASATLLVAVREEKPGVTISGPQRLSASEGQSVTLRCETQGLVNAVIQWRRRKGPLPSNYSIQGGTLYIPRFRREYAGEYICAATTQVRNYETSVYITVTVTPKLSISPAVVEARAGQTVQLRCQPQGQGTFNIEWVKLGGALSSSATQTADGILEIRAVTAADAGRYRCVATNSAGSSDGIAVVIVEVPPTIVVSNRNRSLREGETVTLQCQITGTPQPQVTWKKKGGALPSNSDIRNDILTICNVRSEDQGHYICNARSTAGSARDYIMLTVQSDCRFRRYGKECKEECGYCRGNETCNHINGSCPGSCEPGYHGEKCITACSNGKYGNDCRGKCGHCARNETCHHINGSCPGSCEAGYQGRKCLTACSSGRYGNDCRGKCGHCARNKKCHHISGSCPGLCQAGYQGKKCLTVCTSRRYGKDCQEVCGHCKGNKPCNHINGSCPGLCEPGYHGEKCLVACFSGRYGNDCKEKCGHCASNKTCHHTSGSCPGLCRLSREQMSQSLR